MQDNSSKYGFVAGQSYSRVSFDFLLLYICSH